MAGFNPSPNPKLYETMPQAYMSMGLTAENLCKKFPIPRKAQEEFAIESHKKAAKADFVIRTDGSFEEIDWDTAIAEVAQRLASIRDEHGGETIFYYGGGGQGNHLGGTYARKQTFEQWQAIISANIGCIQHLQTGTATPVKHWIEVLAAAIT